MLFDFLDKLRRKDQYERSRIAFVTALVITGIIALGWALSIPARFSEVADNIAESKESTAEETSAMGGIEDIVKNAELFRKPAQPQEEPEDVEVTASSTGDLVMPRQVLISTSSDDKSE